MTDAQFTKLLTDQGAALANVNGTLRDYIEALDVDYRRRVWTPICSNCTLDQMMISRRPAFLRSITIYNRTDNTDYAQVFNASQPTDEGATPFLPPISLVGAGPGYFDGGDGVFFSEGIFICGSSTDLQKTLIPTHDLFFFALYRLA